MPSCHFAATLQVEFIADRRNCRSRSRDRANCCESTIHDCFSTEKIAREKLVEVWPLCGAARCQPFHRRLSLRLTYCRFQHGWKTNDEAHNDEPGKASAACGRSDYGESFRVRAIAAGFGARQCPDLPWQTLIVGAISLCRG